MFTIGKVPALNEESMKRSDAFLQHVLVKTLLKVATKYRTGYLATVLTTSFLGPLLKLALVDDAQVRLLTQQILHTLVDRSEWILFFFIQVFSISTRRLRNLSCLFLANYLDFLYLKYEIYLKSAKNVGIFCLRYLGFWVRNTLHVMILSQHRIM